MNNKFLEFLEKMNINKKTQFYRYFAEFGGFNNELIGDYEEVMSIDEIYNYNFPSENNFWNAEYPDINKQFLMLSSIEGGGSYFYSILDEKIYDVSFSDMNNLINGSLKARWETFDDFAKEINGGN